MNQINQTASVDDDRLDFLNLLAVAAESWKLIVIGTLLVAMVTAFILFLRPPVYESFTYTYLSPQTRAILVSAKALTPIVEANNLAASFNGDVETAMRVLREKIKVEELAKDSGIYRVGILADTPAQAKTLADGLLAQVLLNSKPLGSEAEKIKQKLNALRNAIADLQKLSERLTSSSGNVPTGTEGETYVRALAIMVNEIVNKKTETIGLEKDLGGLKMQDILQRPNLPILPIPRQRLKTLIAVTGAAFVALIFFAYLRDASRKVDENSERAKKIRRICDALGWRRNHDVVST